jgi:hypothetical protein
VHNITPALAPVPLEAFLGLVTLASPDSLPEGASPRCYDNDYLVGETHLRPGTTSVYTYSGESVGPNGATSVADVTGPAPWNDMGAVLIGGSGYASCYPGTAVVTTPVHGLPPRQYVPGADPLNITGFGFNLPSTITPTGVILSLNGYATSVVTLSAQLLIAGVAAGVAQTVSVPSSAGTFTLGGLGNSWGAALTAAAANGTEFGVQITASSAFPLAELFLGYMTVQLGVTTANANFNFVTSFEAQDGAWKNLSLDANGDLWVEDATNNPGTLTLAYEGITPGSYANGVNGPDVEYLAFNDLTAGCDIPRQYTPKWIDRISQVGPGAPPVFSASSAQSTTYAISTITQPTAKAWQFAYFLQSTGPGSNQAGNVVTVYYADSTQGPADADLVNAFNSGNAVYLYTSFTGGPATQGPYTVIVTSVGEGTPPGQPRQFYYFTYQVSTSVYTLYSGSGQPSYTAHYQRTLATMTTSVPVPQLTVGTSAVVSGNSVTAWDATWPITQTLNSGAMAITQTSLTSGIATYSYAVVSGANPTAGQLVTITGTLNANGQLNVVNNTIAAVTGTNLGTFTINNFSAATNYGAQSESGQATTAGTEFDFEPGMLTLGTSNSPIYGTGTGGVITVSNVGQYVSAGTKQGCMGFITRNGYWTPPSIPVTFTVPNNTTAINYSQAAIGPPNVVGRYFLFTESGALGVPGGFFFNIPVPVQYIVENVAYTATATVIMDNVTTSGSFFFTDSVLLAAQACDVQGNNLFNLIEIGNPGWIVNYASRNFYGLCQNKIQNFLNLSFDGGYNPGAKAVPLGWTIPDQYGKLVVSPIFGNSYYIQNTSASMITSGCGLIQQGAYQDYYQVPIINANTAYSVRVTARCPSGITGGFLEIQLVANGIAYGSFGVQFSAMSTSYATYTGTFLTVPFATVPPALVIWVYGQNMAPGADLEIDRIEVFNTAIPVLATTVYASYVANPESVDGDNQLILNGNPQPVNFAQEMYDTLYFLKGSSMYSTQASANLEPANWTINEVSQKSGSIGINSSDVGEQWIVSGCRNGIYLFAGGQPGKIMQEIYQIWDAINWSAGNSIWIKNDVVARRLLVGIPLPTPNFWLPNAPANAAPTSPNVMLMLNYQGIDSGAEIMSSPGMHTTMFGTLNAIDMRRKWSIWQIPSPYAAFVQQGGAEITTVTQAGGHAEVVTTSYAPPQQQMYICNGIASSKVYALDPTNETDDGTPISFLYTTAGFGSATHAAKYPLLGMFRKRWKYGTLTMSNSATANVRLLPNQLLGPDDSTNGYYPWTVPGGFSAQNPALEDREFTCNFVAQRTFMEFTCTGAISLSRAILAGAKDVWNTIRGVK